MAAIPTFPEFNTLDQSNLAIRWEKYLLSFNNLITAMDIKDDSRNRPLLLHYIGEGANDIFYTLPERREDKDYKKACDALTRYFTSKKIISFEIFKFRNPKQ